MIFLDEILLGKKSLDESVIGVVVHARDTVSEGCVWEGVRRAASVPEDVLDDLEAALTRIDSSATDDEALVRPSSGRNVVLRRSTTEGS